MGSISIVFVSTLASVMVLAACGSENKANYRRERVSGLEAAADAKKVTVSFQLPDRSVDPALADIVTGYYYSLKGEGANCPNGQLHEASGAYEDEKMFLVKVDPLCDYAVTYKLGALASPTLTAPINFQDDMKALFAQNCVSCHETFGDYAQVLSSKDDIVRAIETGAMPPTGPLSDGDVAKVLAWSEGGYLEKDPTPAPTETAQALSQVYYRNNNNDFIMAYEMLGRIAYEMRRSLWLQPDGEAKALKTGELQTFTPPKPSPTP